MRWIAACTLLLWASGLPPEASAQAHEGYCLPAAAGPTLERIMQEQDVGAHMGPGWSYGDARITADTITIPVLHEQEPAAVITLTRPQAAAHGRWFSHDVSVERPAAPQTQSTLTSLAGLIDRGFASTPWSAPCRGKASREVPCAFCSAHVQDWPLQVTRRRWISLLLGALVALSLLLGMAVAIGFMGAQIRHGDG